MANKFGSHFEYLKSEILSSKCVQITDSLPSLRSNVLTAPSVVVKPVRLGLSTGLSKAVMIPRVLSKVYSCTNWQKTIRIERKSSKIVKKMKKLAKKFNSTIIKNRQKFIILRKKSQKSSKIRLISTNNGSETPKMPKCRKRPPTKPRKNLQKRPKTHRSSCSGGQQTQESPQWCYDWPRNTVCGLS